MHRFERWESPGLQLTGHRSLVILLLSKIDRKRPKESRVKDTCRPPVGLWFRPGIFPKIHVLEAWPQPMVLFEDREASGGWG